MRSWVVGYPDMRLTQAQLMKKYGRYNYKRLGELWPTYPEFRGLEVGLWLQAEQRHRNSKLATAAEIRAEKIAKERFADHKRISGRYVGQAELDRLMMKEVLRGASYGRGAETFRGRRFIGISEPEEALTASWEPRVDWEPQGELFISSGKKIDLGLLEQRGLDKMKEIRYEGNKPVLYLDPEADEAIMKG